MTANPYESRRKKYDPVFQTVQDVSEKIQSYLEDPSPTASNQLADTIFHSQTWIEAKQELSMSHKRIINLLRIGVSKADQDNITPQQAEVIQQGLDLLLRGEIDSIEQNSFVQAMQAQDMDPMLRLGERTDEYINLINQEQRETLSRLMDSFGIDIYSEDI